MNSNEYQAKPLYSNNHEWVTSCVDRMRSGREAQIYARSGGIKGVCAVHWSAAIANGIDARLAN